MFLKPLHFLKVSERYLRLACRSGVLSLPLLSFTSDPASCGYKFISATFADGENRLKEFFPEESHSVWRMKTVESDTDGERKRRKGERERKKERGGM